MGSAVMLRWNVNGVDCQLQMRDGVGDLSLIQNGVVVATAKVNSAAAAHEWAAERVHALTAPPGQHRSAAG